MKAVSAAARFELFFPLLSIKQLVADIETCFVGGEVGGRVLQGETVYYDSPVSVKMV